MTRTIISVLIAALANAVVADDQVQVSRLGSAMVYGSKPNIVVVSTVKTVCRDAPVPVAPAPAEPAEPKPSRAVLLGLGGGVAGGVLYGGPGFVGGALGGALVGNLIDKNTELSTEGPKYAPSPIAPSVPQVCTPEPSVTRTQDGFLVFARYDGSDVQVVSPVSLPAGMVVDLMMDRSGTRIYPVPRDPTPGMTAAGSGGRSQLLPLVH